MEEKKMKKTGILPFDRFTRKTVHESLTKFQNGEKTISEVAEEISKKITKLHYEEIEAMYEVYTLTKNLLGGLENEDN